MEKRHWRRKAMKAKEPRTGCLAGLAFCPCAFLGLLIGGFLSAWSVMEPGEYTFIAGPVGALVGGIVGVLGVVLRGAERVVFYGCVLLGVVGGALSGVNTVAHMVSRPAMTAAILVTLAYSLVGGMMGGVGGVIAVLFLTLRRLYRRRRG